MASIHISAEVLGLIFINCLAINLVLSHQALLVCVCVAQLKSLGIYNLFICGKDALYFSGFNSLILLK